MSFWDGRRVFVTGHTGFKGAWLSNWLALLGAKVTGYSLPPPTSPSLFVATGLERRMTSRIADIRDYPTLRKAIQEAQPEFIFHLAAQPLVRQSYVDPVETYATNVMGTVHVLEAVRELGAKCVLVNITSDKCYENREWAWGYRENESMGGFDPYSSSKGCAELVTAAYRRSFFEGQGKVALASARAGNVIGGGDWAADRLIPDCIRYLQQEQAIPIRNPDAVRPWQHVLEPLAGYMLLAERLHQNPTAFAQGWNFGPSDDQARPVRWIADYVTKGWGGLAAWSNIAGDARHEAHLLKLDSSLARQTLGWRPVLTLPRALDLTLDWFKRQGGGEDAYQLTVNQIKTYMALRDEAL